MSEAMILNNALKSFPEVASLTSVDTLFAVGSDGSPKKVSLVNALNNSKSESWSETLSCWRTVMEASSDEAYGGILGITSGEWCGNPTLHLFAIGGRYQNTPLMPEIVSLLGTTTLIKLRAVKSGNKIRIDAFSQNRRMRTFAAGLISLSALVANPTVPADATVQEYNFTTSVRGGVNGYLSIVYNPTQKGGLPYERSESAHQRGAQSGNDRRNGLPWAMQERGHMLILRDMANGQLLYGTSAKCREVGHSGSYGHEPLYITEIYAFNIASRNIPPYFHHERIAHCLGCLARSNELTARKEVAA